MTDRGEEYVRVRGRVMEVRPKAVLFAVGDSVPRGDWIPRTLIHGGDERTLDAIAILSHEMTLRIFEWKADELGFTSGRSDAGALGDLFEGGE